MPPFENDVGVLSVPNEPRSLSRHSVPLIVKGESDPVVAVVVNQKAVPLLIGCDLVFDRDM